ncbi:MAG TPA: hypothetical protein PKD90_03485 [Phnomibacter sp.]|nr:hypothetical protein [Phnomibacter sp.]
MSNISTPSQRSAIAAACARLALGKEDKAALVSQYSQGKAISTTELTKAQAAALLQALSRGLTANPRQQAAECMRRKVIAIFHECGWQQPGTASIDMARVNAWCIHHGYLHKKLNAYTYAELPKLVTQAKKYLEWYLSSLAG